MQHIWWNERNFTVCSFEVLREEEHVCLWPEFGLPIFQFLVWMLRISLCATNPTGLSQCVCNASFSKHKPSLRAWKTVQQFADPKAKINRAQYVTLALNCLQEVKCLTGKYACLWSHLIHVSRKELKSYPQWRTCIIQGEDTAAYRVSSSCTLLPASLWRQSALLALRRF